MRPVGTRKRLNCCTDEVYSARQRRFRQNFFANRGRLPLRRAALPATMLETYGSWTPMTPLLAAALASPRCTAHRTNGEPCRAAALRGANVCYTHGGAAPQVRLAAQRRIMMASEAIASRLI